MLDVNKLQAILTMKWKDVSDADKALFNAHVLTIMSKPSNVLSEIEKRALRAYLNHDARGTNTAKAKERREVFKISVSDSTKEGQEGKGGVMVYGLGAQRPVTLYCDQWDILFAHIEEVKAFVAANRERCKLLEAARDAREEALRKAKASKSA